MLFSFGVLLYIVAMSEYQPKYRWRHTGFANEQDFCCWVGERNVGRIYLANEMSEDGWRWSMYAHGPDMDRQGRITHGYVATPREAARHVEEAWDFAKPKDLRIVTSDRT
ncbi:hypothetical protein GRZ55_11070 [Chelativorans sp. ZYF759]|uniref:hypothetical protein n=1 Tax=Chelativorans sp. ZYF759 TaxID=2692213 RepID=UPI00145DDD5A|nr:hypothetical protein [Chelativorans sp. ZYF759]NMG39784.1 hypothetical protein [Chelativorans sp. ZYF759]